MSMQAFDSDYWKQLQIKYFYVTFFRPEVTRLGPELPDYAQLLGGHPSFLVATITLTKALT